MGAGTAAVVMQAGSTTQTRATGAVPDAEEEAGRSEMWAEAAGAIDWIRRPSCTLSQHPDGAWGWFADGTLNTCFNAVDRHVRDGRGSQAALIFDSAMTGARETLTYAELLDRVAQAAGMLASLGIARGNRVVIYMPMIPEAVVAMLACARIGAIHSVVFGGFAAAELAKRIDDCEPLLVITASCGLEPGKTIPYLPLVETALQIARHRVSRCIVVQRAELAAPLVDGRDVAWSAAIADARPVDCVELDSEDPLYILYTSGTTGVPKGVVRDNGGHAVALRWSMEHIYGAKAGDVFWAASDIGWVVGHSYIVYAPLLTGCTTVLFEGKPVGTPDAGTFWRVVDDYSVNILFTAPTAIRAIRRDDPEGRLTRAHARDSLRALFLAGERADPGTVEWARDLLGIPVIDHWWQTELGWPAVATCLGRGETATVLGSAGRAVPGFVIAALGDAHRPLGPGETGDLAIALPLPPGCSSRLWNNGDGFTTTYLTAHPGWYTTGDAGFVDGDGYVHFMTRIDDIINVAGHRLSTGAIEQAVAAHPSVAECAVVATRDAIKGHVPLAFIVRRTGDPIGQAALIREIQACVRTTIGRIAVPKTVIVVAQLPKTRSGKLLRAAIRKLADGETIETPPTIENPQSLDLIAAALAEQAAATSTLPA